MERMKPQESEEVMRKAVRDYNRIFQYLSFVRGDCATLIVDKEIATEFEAEAQVLNEEELEERRDLLIGASLGELYQIAQKTYQEGKIQLTKRICGLQDRINVYRKTVPLELVNILAGDLGKLERECRQLLEAA